MLSNYRGVHFSMPPIKVLIVDDHPVVRRGLQSILGEAGDLQVVGEASNGSEALKQVGALKPDVILMDIRLPGADGVQITRRVRREYPEAKVIILTTYDDDQHLYNAIEAGAHGFLTKHADYSDLAESIRAVARGERLLSPALVGKVLDQFQHLARAQALQQSGLNEQEIELLRLIAEGETNKQIGDKLFWSEVTVKRRASEVYSKLNVADRAQAVAEAMRRGLI
jgi:DNA-binding NarL/FixJ family response regulator